MIVADDLGYNDLGARNSYGHGLIGNGVTLSSYYTFKVCSPSRASSLTGRYPWGAGFYDMTVDGITKPRMEGKIAPSAMCSTGPFNAGAIMWAIKLDPVIQ